MKLKSLLARKLLTEVSAICEPKVKRSFYQNTSNCSKVKSRSTYQKQVHTLKANQHWLLGLLPVLACLLVLVQKDLSSQALVLAKKLMANLEVIVETKESIEARSKGKEVTRVHAKTV